MNFTEFQKDKTNTGWSLGLKEFLFSVICATFKKFPLITYLSIHAEIGDSTIIKKNDSNFLILFGD